MQNEKNFVIRRAEKKDIPEMLRLLVEVNMVHHTIRPDLFKGPATKYTEADLEKRILQIDDPIFICEDADGTFYGYIFCETQQTPDTFLRCGMKTLYIDDLCVDEISRGHHVGEKLYHAAMDYARETGCYNVTLHVWEGNDGAEKFYRAMGMKPQYTCMETIL